MANKREKISKTIVKLNIKCKKINLCNLNKAKWNNYEIKLKEKIFYTNKKIGWHYKSGRKSKTRLFQGHFKSFRNLEQKVQIEDYFVDNTRVWILK